MGIVGILVILAALAVVGITGGMIWGIRHPSLPAGDTKVIGGGDEQSPKVISGHKEQKRLMGANGFSFLDIESGATPEDIKGVLGAYREDETLGTYAAATCVSLERAQFSSDGITSLMEREFGHESLTWDRFAVPVEAAFGAICSNSARIANIIQAFDSEEYRRLARLSAAGQLHGGGQQASRLEAMTSQLDELQDLSYGNEAMLDELNGLQTELAKLADSHQTVTFDEIAGEVRNLASDTKRYMPRDAEESLDDMLRDADDSLMLPDVYGPPPVW